MAIGPVWDHQAAGSNPVTRTKTVVPIGTAVFYFLSLQTIDISAFQALILCPLRSIGFSGFSFHAIALNVIRRNDGGILELLASAAHLQIPLDQTEKCCYNESDNEVLEFNQHEKVAFCVSRQYTKRKPKPLEYQGFAGLGTLDLHQIFTISERNPGFDG